MSNNYKQGDRVKWIAVALAGILLAGACITSIVMGVKHNGWFKKAETEQKQEQTDLATPDKEASGGMVAKPTSSNRMRLLSTPLTASADGEASPQAEEGYTITATVYASDNQVYENMQKVTFTMAWESENSANVTDYVTMTTTDNSATVTCKQAFGTQIQMKVTSVIDPSVSAWIIFDYYERMVVPADKTINWEQNEVGGADIEKNILENISYIEPTFGVGSLHNRVVSYKMEITALKPFMQALKTYSGGVFGGDTEKVLSLSKNEIYLTQQLFMKKIMESDAPENLYFWQKAVANSDNQLKITYTVKPQYGEEKSYAYFINMTAKDINIIKSIKANGSYYVF